ncbi:MAG: CBS domain-containing protein [Nitrospiraceae bacterium]|nr:MAG: CBS domain-containing protein [Nitrospiraceae bacterium]
MFVADWMTRKVVTVTPDETIAAAAKLCRDKGIKHLPVIQRRQIKGILSDRDIREYVPSRAKTLDVCDLHAVIENTKVKDVMRTDIVLTTADTPVEEAAMIMLDNNIGCLPVVQGSMLVGIISDRDIYRVLVDISGVRHRGHRICLPLEDRPGSLNEIVTIIRKQGFRLQSILTSYEGVKQGSRRVVIRIKGAGNFRALKAELESTYIGVKIRKG